MTISQTPAGDRILRAAGRLFYERGINNVGVELIAREAAVTKKTIYDRFESKDRLIECYLVERSERWRRCLTAAVDAAPSGPARLLATFDALDTWLPNQERRGCAFVNAWADLPDAARPGRRVAEEEKAWLLGYLRELAEAAGARSPVQLASQLFMLHEGAVVGYSLTGDDEAPATARRAAATLIENDTIQPS